MIHITTGLKIHKNLKVGMGPSTCSLGARSVLRVFEGAPARVLWSKHMLGSLVLGLDAGRVFSEHQGITEWYKMEKITALKAEKNSKFTVHSILLPENLRHVYVIVFVSNSPGVERRAVDISSQKNFKRESLATKI